MESHEQRVPLRVPHDRRSIRLPGFDYTEPGRYFATICTRNRRPLFGAITNGASHLNPMGWRVKQCWLAIPRHFPFVELDAFIVMPDHVHGIIRIMDDGTGTDPVGARHAGHDVGARHAGHDVGARHAGHDVGARHALPLQMSSRPRSPAAMFGHPPPRALSAIVGSFKSAAARAVNLRWGLPGPSIWQRNYYEHIIRNEDALRRIRRYIETNAERWGTS